jgi:MFS family permease
MTQVGETLAIYFGGAFVGNMIGGAFADKFGRKVILIAGLVLSAASSLAMGLVNNWDIFAELALIAGLCSELGAPAVQAMIADILPLEKRTDGLGILRVVINLAVTIGPAIGGILAGVDFLFLFLGDVIISITTAIIVFFALPETKPALKQGQLEETFTQSLIGYRRAFTDKIFMAVIFLSMLTALVYMQINTTLSVFLRDIHAVTAQYYGYLLSINAAVVVFFQFFVTRHVKRFHPLLVLAAGNLFFALGFGLFAFTSRYWHFIVSILIITAGRMLYGPVIQALIANIAPEDARGRYLAVFHTVWVLAAGLAPWAAGFVLDNFDPNWIWYAAGFLSVIVALGCVLLKRRVGPRYLFHAKREKENMA